MPGPPGVDDLDAPFLSLVHPSKRDGCTRDRLPCVTATGGELSFGFSRDHLHSTIYEPVRVDAWSWTQ